MPIKCIIILLYVPLKVQTCLKDLIKSDKWEKAQFNNFGRFDIFNDNECVEQSLQRLDDEWVRGLGKKRLQPKHHSCHIFQFSWFYTSNFDIPLIHVTHLTNKFSCINYYSMSLASSANHACLVGNKFES